MHTVVVITGIWLLVTAITFGAAGTDLFSCTMDHTETGRDVSTKAYKFQHMVHMPNRFW